MSTNGTTAVAAATGKRPSTNIGEPLSEESLRLVREVRRQLTVPLHSNFDSDFNVYRFVANAERTQKARMNRKELVDAAARALNGHLRVRNCLRLDDLPDVTFERNRLFREHFLPTSPILEGTDSQNRLLWFIEYRSLSVETIAHGIRSSESIRCQFWQFEHMLRKVNEQERRSGRLSSVRHVVDMAGYELNPFTFGFLSSGTLSYYSQLLHYDNYPELVYPIEMVNIAKWIHIPYRLIKAMMPAGFTDRFRLHDDNFLEAMSSEIPIEHIPRTLGGQNPTRCVPAQRMAASQYWQPSHPALLGQLETVQIGPRKHKLFRVQIQEQQQQKGQQQQLQQQVLSWYLRTDGDIFFGVFYEPPPPTKAEQQRGDSLRQHNGNGHGHQEVIKIGNGKDNNIHQPPENEQKQQQSPATVEHMETVFEWVYPLFKLTAKIHHEWDCVDCSRPGTYWLLLSNRHSWLHRRTVDVLVQLSGGGKGEAEDVNGTTDGSSGSWTKRIWQDGGEELLAPESRPLMDVRACLQLEPAHMFGPRD